MTCLTINQNDSIPSFADLGQSKLHHLKQFGTCLGQTELKSQTHNSLNRFQESIESLLARWTTYHINIDSWQQKLLLDNFAYVVPFSSYLNQFISNYVHTALLVDINSIAMPIIFRFSFTSPLIPKTLFAYRFDHLSQDTRTSNFHQDQSTARSLDIAIYLVNQSIKSNIHDKK